MLGLAQIGIHDNFFEVGGHSLIATQVMSRVRQTFGIDLPLASLFNAPTIAGLAARVDDQLRRDLGTDMPPLVPAARDRTLPLSFAQQRLWFLDQLAPGGAAYAVAGAFSISGPLDVDALARSLNDVVRRHEVLRTRIAVGADGEPMQVIVESLQVPLPVTDLRGRSRAELRRRIDEEAHRPFDLTAGPLLRTELLWIGDQEHVLLITMHHIVSDGWSQGIFVREVVTLYQSALAGAPARLPELPIQYADYALWQRQWQRAEVLERQLAYWRARLADAPLVVDLPFDRPRPASSTLTTAHYVIAISKELTDALKLAIRQVAVTPFMALLSAYAIVLRHWSGQADLLIGTDIANRTHVEIEGLIGFFVNQLVLRVDLSSNPTLDGVLAQVRETTLGAYAHQDLPFDTLVAELRPPRAASLLPFFQTKFVLQNAPAESFQLPGLSIANSRSASGEAKCELLTTAWEAAGAIRFDFEYAVELFDPTTIDQFGARLIATLEQLVSDRTTHVEAARHALAAAERHDRERRQSAYRRSASQQLSQLRSRPPSTSAPSPS
jgi:acyl carrier protein